MNNDNDQKYRDDQSNGKEYAERTDSSNNGSSSYRSEENSYRSEDAQFTPIAEQSGEPQRASGPTYYSYGNTRPMDAVQQSTSDAQGAVYSRTNGAYGGSGTYGSAPQQPTSPTSQYRPFTTTNGGGDPLSAKKEKKRSGGFGKLFLSFMAGVVAVGILMYTADTQNWFSQETMSTPQSNYQSGVSNTGGNSSSSNTNTSSSLMMDRPDNIAELFSTASPAVVKIETYSKASRNSSNSLFNDPFFRQFFGNNIPGTEDQGNSNELEQSGMGTGFFFDASGYILTNQHVIADSDEIRVIVEGYDEPFVAKLLGSSYDLDLAVLKVEGEQQFPTLSLGDSEGTRIGDWVVAIGNPYGFDHTLTVGVISAKERPIDIPDSDGTRNYKNLLQTDASINPGNSGGPLLNLNGEVIGINTAVSSSAQGIGFAIPTSTITEVLDSLKNNEPIPEKPSPFIGAELQDLTDSLVEQLGLSSKEGAIVRSVYYNSPAYKGDLKQYDVITEVNGDKVTNTTALVSLIQSQEVGTVMEFTVIRNGETLKLPIEIGDKKEFGLE